MTITEPPVDYSLERNLKNALSETERRNAKIGLVNKLVDEAKRHNIILDWLSQMEVTMIPIQTTSIKTSFDQFRGVVAYELLKINSQIVQESKD